MPAMSTAREHVRAKLDAEMQTVLRTVPQISAAGMSQLVRSWLSTHLVSPDIAADIEGALERACRQRSSCNGLGVFIMVRDALTERPPT